MVRSLRRPFAIKYGATTRFFLSVLRRTRKVLNIMKPHPVWIPFCYVNLTSTTDAFSLLRYLVPTRARGVTVRT